MNTALRDLYALQLVDTALAEAQQRYRALDPGRAELAAFEEASAGHAASSAAFHACSGDLRDAELELESVEQKKKELEGKLYGGRVHAFKELETMQQEIEALGRQRVRLDDRILALMDDRECRRAEEETSRRALETAKAALTAKRERHAEASRKLTAQIQDLTAQRARLAEPVAPALLRRYEAIRASKQGIGIARLDDHSCGACRTSLPLNTVRHARETDAPQSCENCGRLLYAEEQ